MALLANPFTFLGASLEDDDARLTELAELKSLNSDTAFESLSQLVHPRRRLAAEFGWLPEVDPALARELLARLESGKVSWDDCEDLPLLAGCNMAAAIIAGRPDLPAEELFQHGLMHLPSAVDGLKPEEIMADLNMLRRKSGFTELNDLDLVTEHLAERRRYYLSVIGEALNRRPTSEIISLVTRMADEATGHGKQVPPLLTEDIIRLYEDETLAFWDKQRKSIDALINRIKYIAGTNRRGAFWTGEIELLVSELEIAVADWSHLSKPVFFLAESYDDIRGEHYNLATDLLNLSSGINNAFSLYKAAYTINELILAFFPDVGDTGELAQGNKKILGDNVRRFDSAFRRPFALTAVRAFKVSRNRRAPKHLDPELQGHGFAGVSLWAAGPISLPEDQFSTDSWDRLVEREQKQREGGEKDGCFSSFAQIIYRGFRFVFYIWLFTVLLKGFLFLLILFLNKITEG